MEATLNKKDDTYTNGFDKKKNHPKSHGGESSVMRAGKRIFLIVEVDFPTRKRYILFWKQVLRFARVINIGNMTFRLLLWQPSSEGKRKPQK